MLAERSVRKLLLFEIGGTRIRTGVCDELEPTPTKISYRDTPNYLSLQGADPENILQALLAEMALSARDVLGDECPSAVVVGYPGPIGEDGIAVRSPTIFGPDVDREMDVGRAIAGLWSGTVPVTVLNDLTCAGYYWVAQGYRDFCIMTVGSGVGNKVFIDGAPVVGSNGRGGEIGHVRSTLPEGTPIAGLWGEIGAMSSGRGVAWIASRWLDAKPQCAIGTRLAGRTGSNLRSEDLVLAFHAGDDLAHQIIEAACRPLALAMATVHLAIGIEHFVIVGGFAKALGERYRRLLAGVTAGYTWNVGEDWNSMLELGSPDVEEGLLGAGYYGTQFMRSPLSRPLTAPMQ